MKNRKALYLIIAGIVGLIIIIPWLIKSPKTPDNQMLFTSNFVMPEPSVNRSGPSETTWESANYFYTKKEYDKAIEQFSIILSDTTFKRKSQVYLLMGASQIANGDIKAGIESLEQINDSSIEWHRALWYKGLAQMNLNQTLEARKNFEIIIAEGNSEYSKQAAKLLKQI